MGTVIPFKRTHYGWVGCSSPIWDGMGGNDPCGRCDACTAPKRREAIRQMVAIAVATQPNTDEWDLRIAIVKSYDGGA